MSSRLRTQRSKTVFPHLSYTPLSKTKNSRHLTRKLKYWWPQLASYKPIWIGKAWEWESSGILKDCLAALGPREKTVERAGVSFNLHEERTSTAKGLE
jgi:hypothetical protein